MKRTGGDSQQLVLDKRLLLKMIAPATKKKSDFKKMRIRENIAGWLFCSPIIIGMLAFTAVPVALSLYSTTLRWNGLVSIFDAPSVGFGNFENVLFNPNSPFRAMFLRGLRNTVIMLIYVPITMALGLGLALMVNRKMRGTHLWRVIYYVPGITSVVAVTVIFNNLFMQHGVINTILRNNFGMEHGIQWLTGDFWVIVTIGILSAWRGMGFGMLMYLAGLQQVSGELVEAARIDGANAWLIFRKITLPALYPITFFLLVTGIMGGFQIFDAPFLLIGEGPGHNAVTMVSFVFFNFEARQMGMAAVGAWVLALIVFVVTAIQIIWDNRKDKNY